MAFAETYFLVFVKLLIFNDKKRKSNIRHANKIKKIKAEEWHINRKFQEASLAFQNNSSQENLSTLNVLKEKIEQMYDKKAEGIIIRSRARWYEHREKILNIFLI